MLRQIMSPFKTNTTKKYSKPRRVNNVFGGQKKSKKPKIKKQSEDIIIKAIKDRIIKDIRKLAVQKEDYCKPVRVGNFYSNNYIEYESNGDRNKLVNQRIP